MNMLTMSLIALAWLAILALGFLLLGALRNQAKTEWALSSATTVRLPHGYQNAVLMPQVAAYNYEAVSPRTQKQLDRLTPLYERIDFDPHFGADEIDAAAAESMVTVAMMAPLSANNVRQPTADELHGLLRATGAGQVASGADSYGRG